MSPYNAGDAFNQALELFSGLYQDMNPTDVPAGLSPDNQDVWFLPGSVQTRPGMARTIVGQFPDRNIVSVADFILPTGQAVQIYMDSEGQLFRFYNPTQITIPVSQARFSAGAQFQAESAFDKQFYASFGQNAFPASPYCGLDPPQYYDGIFTWRVTQDAPGAPPTSIVDVNVAGLVTAGVHNCVVMFEMANGQITGPSIPVQFTAAGNKKLLISGIPKGPPGTVSRILAFTPAAGTNYFYLSPAIIPSVAGLPTIVQQGPYCSEIPPPRFS
jgi:hypothetical protein